MVNYLDYLHGKIRLPIDQPLMWATRTQKPLLSSILPERPRRISIGSSAGVEIGYTGRTSSAESS